MGNDELYHKLYSELAFNRAVMSFMAALLMHAVDGPRKATSFLCFYGVLCMAKSATEWIRA